MRTMSRIAFRLPRLAVASLAALVPAATAAQKAVTGARPALPCCGITAVSTSTGVVTAHEQSTGREFQFRVTDRALLGALHAGQPVWADFGTNKVSISYGEPCCNVIGFVTPRATVSSPALDSSSPPVRKRTPVTRRGHGVDAPPTPAAQQEQSNHRGTEAQRDRGERRAPLPTSPLCLRASVVA